MLAVAFALAGIALWVVRRLPSHPRGPSLPRKAQSQRSTAEPRPRVSPPFAAPSDTQSAWTSRQGCEALLARHPISHPSSIARIGSWNLRWFPDGVPGKRKRSGRGTDIEWLACAIALMDVDVLAVQEVKTLPRSLARLSELRALIERTTGRRYRVELDPCENESGQHVGFMFDETRVTAGEFHTYASLNPRGAACADQLRPGFGGHFRFARGLDAHLISVHFKSGSSRRAFELRRATLDGLVAAYREAENLVADSDVMLLGDFNTMGCAHCSPAVDADTEIREMSARLAANVPPFRLVAQSGGCSEYHAGHGALLDHFVASATFSGLPAQRRATVSGMCGDSACRTLPARHMPAAYRALSDHCPILIDLNDPGTD